MIPTLSGPKGNKILNSFSPKLFQHLKNINYLNLLQMPGFHDSFLALLYKRCNPGHYAFNFLLQCLIDRGALASKKHIF